MNFRTTYLLFGLVAVLLIGVLVMMAFGPGPGDEYVLKSLHESNPNREQLAEIKKAIDRLEVERLNPSGDPLVFVHAGDTWKLEAPYEAKIDAGAIDRAVTDLLDAKIDKTADITHKLAPLGLESPSAVVTLRKGKDTYRIALGNMTAGGHGVVFATVSDRGKEPVAVPRAALDNLLKAGAGSATTAGEAVKSVTDFRPRGLLAEGAPNPWDVVTMVGLKEGGHELVVQRAEDGAWRFVKPADYGPADLEGDTSKLGPADENLAGVKPLLTRLSGFQIPTDPADVIENPPTYDA